MQTLRQDLSYALRQMRLTPVFTLTAMLTLALGIGATTAIFSLIHTVMLKSLPVVDPSRLYRIGENNSNCCVQGGPQDDWGMVSYPLYLRLKDSAPEFEQMTAFQSMSSQFSVRRGESDHEAKPLRGEFVTGNYFSTFGLGAFAGRAFTAADDQPTAAPVAVLSYRAWQQEYGSDPSVIGSTFIVEGHPFTIIGIAPPGFFGETLRSNPPEIWLPLQQEPMVNGGNSLLKQSISAWLRVIGRAKPGADMSGVSALLTGFVRNWMMHDSGYPAEFMPQVEQSLPKQFLRITPAGIGVGEMRQSYGDSLRILITVCSLVLLIACANVANLLLARGTARRAQTSVRLALGASRRRLIRQSLTESILLSVLGGIAGILVAYGGVKVIVALAFRSSHAVPIAATPSLPVLAFAFGLSLLTGILFGTAPAWLTSRADPAEALRGANRSTQDHSSFPQKILVIVQAALSIVLLAGAGLLTRSLGKLEHQNLGFETDRRLSILMNSPLASYSEPQLDALYRELQDRLSHLPGVKSAGLALYTPFIDNWGELIVLEGHGAPQMDENANSSIDRVSPGFLETMGQPILRGRSISEQDTRTARNVAVVNETFVRRFLKDQDPIGKHFGLDLAENSTSYEIVGVVRDAKYTDSRSPAHSMVFLPLAQYVNYKNPLMLMFDHRTHYITGAVLHLRGSEFGMEPLIRKAFSEVDPNLTILNIQSMQEQVEANFDQERVVAQMTGLFGILALVLAAIGLYGVTAYTVERRTSEIGVRMALGANRKDVVRLVLRGAFLQIVIGLAIGIPISIACGRLIAAQLYQVKSWDPLVLTGSVIALGICALIASILPAQRAASIDPVKALRME
ncbi:ABC transporter permease [Alloacidobacterium dinghuense]|uniref:ABC transporter permease n=1 Tax=Alloacidobacterium dinghuense TaxID=2763107 RepID=A0A7G8BKL5_9BACT|nr:ABC transporter permease [Alloacidobacterium dinghuense]QNI33085.1 ABC transporter permease [Alloacidobacterium dinghuense]